MAWTAVALQLRNQPARCLPLARVQRRIQANDHHACGALAHHTHERTPHRLRRGVKTGASRAHHRVTSLSLRSGRCKTRTRLFPEPRWPTRITDADAACAADGASSAAIRAVRRRSVVSSRTCGASPTHRDGVNVSLICTAHSISTAARAWHGLHSPTACLSLALTALAMLSTPSSSSSSSSPSSSTVPRWR